jgi:hypothetical protein
MSAWTSRILDERRRLAEVDPGGEAEAVRPLRVMTPEDWDNEPSWTDHVLARAPGQSLADFITTDDRPVNWFGPIPEGGTAAFVGDPETFKTFAAVQLGLAGASGAHWLGMPLGEPRPFIYVSAEKSRSTVRARLDRMALVGGLNPTPTTPVQIIHRARISFADESWMRVVELVRAFGPRTFVVCDTLASLAGPGFDENRGADMAVVLSALRRLSDLGATVVLVHHRNKHGQGDGGIRLRGHSSLWGEVDGVVEFTRPDRASEAGLIRIDPKDGDQQLKHFTWNRDTFLLELETEKAALTVEGIVGVVEALYQGTPVRAVQITASFPGHGRTAVHQRIGQAVRAGLVGKTRNGPATAYVPVAPRPGRSPDDGDSGLDTERGRWADDVPSAVHGAADDPRTIPGRSTPRTMTDRPSAVGGVEDTPADDPIIPFKETDENSVRHEGDYPASAHALATEGDA